MGFPQFTHVNFFAWVTVDYIREGYLKADIHKSHIHVVHIQWKSHLHAHPHTQIHIHKSNKSTFLQKFHQSSSTRINSFTFKFLYYFFLYFQLSIGNGFLLQKSPLDTVLSSLSPVLEYHSLQYVMVLKSNIGLTVVCLGHWVLKTNMEF